MIGGRTTIIHTVCLCRLLSVTSVWLEFDKLKTALEKPLFWVGGSVVLFALLLLLGGTLGAELFTQRISLLLMLVGVVIYFFGVSILKFLVVPFALLLLAIPIPQIKPRLI